MNSAIGLKICAITSGIKKYELIIKEKKNKHDKIVLLAKSKLNSIEVLVSKAFIGSFMGHDDFFNKQCAKRIWLYERKTQKL